MRPEEIGATAHLGGRVFAGITSRVEGVHRAVAGRVFAATGWAGRPVGPVRTVHDAIAGAVYGGLQIGATGAGAIAGQVLSRSIPPSAGKDRHIPLGNQAVAALNGFAAHHLKGGLDPLAIRMAVRSDGRDIPLTPADLVAVFPAPTAKLALFVHGLAETEDFWRATAPDGSELGYGPLLRADLGYTPVHIRYNTGRHVSDNGRSLGHLLTDLVGAWPAAPEEVLLVGHSMGGLVLRSACHYGSVEGQPWVPLVRHIVYLGTPHLGAPLARAAGLAGWALSRFPETRPFAPFLNGSTDGVKDLRYGYLVEEDWAGCDPDRCFGDHRGDVALLGSAHHHAISATLAADPDSRLGSVVGDLLVQPSSAHGRHRRGRHIPFPVEHSRSLGGLTHFHLVNHPSVWNEIRSLLG